MTVLEDSLSDLVPINTISKIIAGIDSHQHFAIIEAVVSRSRFSIVPDALQRNDLQLIDSASWGNL